MKRLFTLLSRQRRCCARFFPAAAAVRRVCLPDKHRALKQEFEASGRKIRTLVTARDISEHITLKYYYPGDAPTGKAQTALDALNEKTGRKN